LWAQKSGGRWGTVLVGGRKKGTGSLGTCRCAGEAARGSGWGVVFARAFVPSGADGLLKTFQNVSGGRVGRRAYLPGCPPGPRASGSCGGAGGETGEGLFRGYRSMWVSWLSRTRRGRRIPCGNDPPTPVAGDSPKGEKKRGLLFFRRETSGPNPLRVKSSNRLFSGLRQDVSIRRLLGGLRQAAGDYETAMEPTDVTSSISSRNFGRCLCLRALV